MTHSLISVSLKRILRIHMVRVDLYKKLWAMGIY